MSSQVLTLDARVKVPEHVVYRPFPTETVVLSLNTGRYHGLNPTAGRMLELLATRDTLREVAATLAEQYGEPRERLENDVVKLCSDLLERGLIDLDRPPD